MGGGGRREAGGAREGGQQRVETGEKGPSKRTMSV